ncbi:hypothetical protein Patl1_15269 [Pistacia atlantica]|uniref:Uncharacterized protein n=1 Tax=Pistacia atlantica TaxID=434234 RepID=A0ACC1B6G8_9ROSI|nr:hypothetical protein Patl1_15269 [Pistacia atlantica]
MVRDSEGGIKFLKPNSRVRAIERKPELESISTALETESLERQEEKERREKRMREMKSLGAIDDNSRCFFAEFS